MQTDPMFEALLALARAYPRPHVPPPPSLTPRQGAILYAKAAEQLTEGQRDHVAQVIARSSCTPGL